MSLSDAIGHIDQIVQWEQQLMNPAAVNQTTSSGGVAPTNQTTGASAGGSSFANVLAQAQSQGATSAASLLQSAASAALASPAAGVATSTPGLPPVTGSLTPAATGLTSPTPGASPSELLSGGNGQLLTALSSATGAGAAQSTAAGSADPRVAAMVQQADSLVGKPYVWGGGHGGWGPQAGYDCSGFVSAVLHAGGYLSTPADTTTLPSQPGIEPGPGQYVTIYDRNAPGQEGHVIIEINGQFYESGGEHGTWGGGGGVAKISTPSAAYLATFNQVLHPAGL